MLRVEEDSIDEVYETIARHRCAYKNDEDFEYSPIMLVFHEEYVDHSRIKSTKAWVAHEENILKEKQLAAQKAKNAEYAAKKREQEKEQKLYEELRAKYGDAK